MTDTILSKDTIIVDIGDDHSFACTAVTIGRTGENAISQLEITIPEELSGFWAFLDFKKPRGETVKTPKLDIINNKIEYDIPNGLLDVSGNLEVQLVLQNEKGEVWKSATKKFVVLKSIDAGDAIPEKEDFITEAQKILNSTEEAISSCASAIKENTSGAIVSLADVSPAKHIMSVKARSKNLIPYPYAVESQTVNGVTFTNNADGSITVNGTAEGNAFHIFQKNITLSKGSYTLSGCPSGGSPTGFMLMLYDDRNDVPNQADTGAGKSFILENYTTYQRLYIRVEGGTSVNNVIFYPQIGVGTTATPFAPYVDVSTAKLNASGKNLAKVNSANYPLSEIELFNGSITGDFVLTMTNNVTGVENPSSAMIKYVLDGATKYFTSYGLNSLEYGFTTNKAEQKFSGNLTYMSLINYGKATGGSFDDIQLEVGESKTDFESYNGLETYPINADGTVEGVTSIYPTTTLATDKDGVVIDVEYNVDTKKYIDNKFAQLQALILEV